VLQPCCHAAGTSCRYATIKNQLLGQRSIHSQTLSSVPSLTCLTRLSYGMSLISLTLCMAMYVWYHMATAPYTCPPLQGAHLGAAAGHTYQP
jgi:hypothetical protein